MYVYIQHCNRVHWMIVDLRYLTSLKNLRNLNLPFLVCLSFFDFSSLQWGNLQAHTLTFQMNQLLFHLIENNVTIQSSEFGVKLLNNKIKVNIITKPTRSNLDRHTLTFTKFKTFLHWQDSETKLPLHSNVIWPGTLNTTYVKCCALHTHSSSQS